MTISIKPTCTIIQYPQHPQDKKTGKTSLTYQHWLRSGDILFHGVKRKFKFFQYFFLSGACFAWILLCDIYLLKDFLQSSFTKCHEFFHSINFFDYYEKVGFMKHLKETWCFEKLRKYRGFTEPSVLLMSVDFSKYKEKKIHKLSLEGRGYVPIFLKLKWFVLIQRFLGENVVSSLTFLFWFLETQQICKYWNLVVQLLHYKTIKMVH